MTFPVNTSSRYHAQDTDYYCGAACAMMILAEIGVSYTSLDQDDLYDSNNKHNGQGGWYTDPVGLCFTLNERRPASFLPRSFVVHKPLTEAEGTRDVVFALSRDQISAAVLVNEDGHWNVICGLQCDVDPANGPYTIEGFWLNNPVFDRSVASHDGADICGSGGAHGCANEYVTYSEWQTNRFNGCRYDAPGGAFQWISVCDPEEGSIDLPRGRPLSLRADGRRLISAADAITFAYAGLEENHLAQSKFGGDALRSGRFADPLLVQRLDRRSDFYYLIPWERDGRIVALADVDARFGVFKSFRVLSEPADDWTVRTRAATRQPDAIGQLLDGKTFELPEDGGRFKVFPGTYCIPPVLVWKPCRESWSPHLPFYHVVVGGHSLYVRVDGAVFIQLTTGRGA
jgi:hypothetical protein